MDNIFQAAKQQFEGYERADLERFAQILGVDVHPNNKDETVRNNLLAKLGEANVVVTEVGGEPVKPVEHEPVGIQDIDELFQLNLSGRGLWEGRRRLITLSKPDAYEGIHPQFVRWGRQNYWIHYNAQVAVPRPVFNILKDCRPKRLRQQHLTREDGSRAVRNHFIEYNRFQISDMGDTEETLHLPVSQKEQFRQIAELTDGFTKYKNQKFSRGKLFMIAQRLNLHPETRMREFKDDQVRNAILAKLGHKVGLAAA